MSKQQQSITSLPPSPDAEHRTRIIRYTIAMSVRVLCVVLAFFLTGWWQVVAIVGAVALPYFAVVIANVKMNRAGDEVVRPGAIVPYTDETRP